MSISKGSLIDLLSEQQGIAKTAAAEQIDGVLRAISNAASTREKVIIKGFGTFELKHRAARTGRDLKTGLPVPVAARDVLTFKAAKAKD